MLHIITIQNSNKKLILNDFLKELEVPLVIDAEATDSDTVFYYLHRPEFSHTFFAINEHQDGMVEVWMDGLASMADYKFFPYLADCLHLYLTDSPYRNEEGKSIFEQYDEDWAATAIGEEIATLKSVLSIAPRYYLSLPFEPFTYVSKDVLAGVGTCIHSATPRIYGYVQHLLHNGQLKQASEDELLADEKIADLEFDVDVPQHISIGRVKSWQIDGAETWESYAKEDVALLLELGDNYRKGEKVDGVVLNDLGTIYQEGIGVTQNGEQAIYWFTQATKQGDLLFAPSNLGDVFRKGCGTVKASLPNAFKAYLISKDPYAHFRIGQAYEEGWTGKPDMEMAMAWYKKAADEGHHLALKRLNE